MKRILVRPEHLRSVALQFRQAATQMESSAHHLSVSLSGLDWETRNRHQLEAQAGAVLRHAAQLSDTAEGLARYLERVAAEFVAADQQPPGGTAGLAAAGAAIPAAVAGGLTGAAAPPLAIDPFWSAVGRPPLENGQFTPKFGAWAEAFNVRIDRHWQNAETDHVGTNGPDHLQETYRLTPAKLERLWAAATKNHVDPRLLLAILQQEGTGSFNTNADNAAYFGGHGPQPDWEHDLNAALDGPILSKLRLYPHAVKSGFPGTWVEWVNWYTPMDTARFQGTPGVYAEDINWAAGVAAEYSSISEEVGPSGGDPVQAYSQWMGEHSELFQPKHVQGEFVIKQGLLPGANRPNLAVWGENPKPDYPGTTGPTKGFWWFPAPDKFCWFVQKR